MSRHRVILASAGSGKTYELAGRYIDLLARGGAPERILALTFTRKAAGEMLARVIKRLMDAVRSEPARRDLASEIGTELSAARARSLALSLVRRIAGARVQTLDAFLTQSVRAVAPDLGLAPKWRVMDESEQDSVAEDALDRAFDRLPLEQLAATVERMLGEVPLRPYEALRQAATLLHAAWLECPDATRWGVPPTEESDPEHALRLAADLLALPRPQKKSGGDATKLIDALEALVASIRARRWRDALDSTVLAASVNGVGKFGPVAIPEDHLRVLRDLHAAVRLLALHRLAEESGAAAVIAAAFDAAQAEAKRERGVIAFDDLARLLVHGGAADDPELLAFRLDSKIDHVLLDEFQDTSLAQYRCLEPILSEIASQESDRSIFAVGDVKQSLYGWRSAVPDLLPALPERLHLGPAQTRAKSWRSSPAVLDAVNAVFTGIAVNPALADYAPAARRWAEFFEPHRAAKPEIGGEVRVEFTNEPEAKSEDDAPKIPAAELERLHIDQVAARVAAIHTEHPQWSIAVLLRSTTNNRLTRYAEALKKLGIDAAEERGFPLTAEPAVNALLSLLQIAEHPGDAVAGYHVALTALGKVVGLTEPLNAAARRRCSDAIRAEIADRGLESLVRRVRRSLTPSLHELAVARLIEVERLASGFDAAAGATLPEFIRVVEAGSVVDPLRAKVCVMTIHRSKGLEFDAVVLPELSRPWFHKTPRLIVDRGEEGELDPLAPVRRVSVYPAAELQDASTELAAMVRRYRARIVREELSCLYVAMTRARHRLDILLQRSGTGGSQPTCARVLLHTPWGTAAKDDLIARYTHGTLQIAASSLTQPSDRPALREVAIALQPAEGRAPVAPSAKGSSNVAERLTFELTRADVLAAGEVWHYALETIEWLEDGAATRAASLAAQKFRLTPTERDALATRLTRALAGPMGDLFRPDTYAPRGGTPLVLREWPFATAPSPELPALHGRIDRLVVGATPAPNAGSTPLWAEIVDYKVQIAEGDGVAAAEAHRPQLDAYRRAVAGLFRLDPAAVTCVVAFPLGGLRVTLLGSNQSAALADKTPGRNRKKN